MKSSGNEKITVVGGGLSGPVMAMYLAKKYTSKSLPDIGRKFSNRDHTTVIHAVKKINQLIQDDENIKRNITEIKKSLYS